jgi:predicted GIY-YIG superfamily endonuclease
MPIDSKRFVYILRSASSPTRTYVGLTSNVAMRLKAHNAGQNPSTAAFRPWEVAVGVEFNAEDVAVRFEQYLKSGSGRAFTKRHLL